jgi:hypothetical protein
MVIISIPFLILLVTASIIKDTHPGFYKKMNSSLLVKLLLILMIFWWIFRNIVGM